MEIWRDIKGYENLYQISNSGRIKSLTRIDALGRELSERILIPDLTKKGYLLVKLGSRNGYKNYLVHRLVALAFVDNPCSYKFVNHKDENKLNNNFSNLEWCTNSYNHNYGTRNKRSTEHQKKRIVQMDMNSNEIATYESIRDAAKKVGVSVSQLSKHCNKTPLATLGTKKYYSKSVGGYKWKFI